LQAGGRRFEPAWLHPIPRRARPRFDSLPGDAGPVFFQSFFNNTDSAMNAAPALARAGAARERRKREARRRTPQGWGLPGQANKRIRWMPRRPQAMKDAAACEKLRGAGQHALIRRSLNGATPPQGDLELNP
jgi:hypothetical protein